MLLWQCFCQKIHRTDCNYLVLSTNNNVQIGKESLGDLASSAQFSFHVPPFNR